MSSIYEMDHDPEIAEVLRQMANKMQKYFGITLTGNRCTVRWMMEDQLVDVHMIIESVTTPKESHERNQFAKTQIKLRKLIEKHKKELPWLEKLLDEDCCSQ